MNDIFAKYSNEEPNKLKVYYNEIIEQIGDYYKIIGRVVNSYVDIIDIPDDVHIVNGVVNFSI